MNTRETNTAETNQSLPLRVVRQVAGFVALSQLKRGDPEGIETIGRFGLDSEEARLRRAAQCGMRSRLEACLRDNEDGIGALMAVSDIAEGLGMQRNETAALNGLVLEVARRHLKREMMFTLVMVDTDRSQSNPSLAQLALRLVKSLNIGVDEFTDGIWLSDSEGIAFKLYRLKRLCAISEPGKCTRPGERPDRKW